MPSRWLLCISFFLTMSAFSMDPDIHHKVTLDAVEAYGICQQWRAEQSEVISFSYEHLSDLEAVARFIAKGTKIEDTSPLLERLYNWHFYDQFRGTPHAMGKHFLGFRTSMHHIFEKRVRTLEDSLLSQHDLNTWDESSALTLGRVIHFIQDVTIPAHVAPIYHYNIIVINHSDYVDHLPLWYSPQPVISSSDCRAIGDAIASLKQQPFNQAFEQLLKGTAHHTLARIRQKIPAPADHYLANESWSSAFWTIRDPDEDHHYPSAIKSGFAPYGTFGNEGIEQLCESELTEDKTLCADFFRQTYQAARNQTVTAIWLYLHFLQQN